MVDHMFLIMGITFAVGAGLALFFVGFQVGLLSELAAEEWEEMQNMNCEEIKKKDGSGLYWSVDNAKWARAKVKACG